MRLGVWTLISMHINLLWETNAIDNANCRSSPNQFEYTDGRDSAGHEANNVNVSNYQRKTTTAHAKLKVTDHKKYVYLNIM